MTLFWRNSFVRDWKSNLSFRWFPLLTYFAYLWFFLLVFITKDFFSITSRSGWMLDSISIEKLLHRPRIQLQVFIVFLRYANIRFFASYNERLTLPMKFLIWLLIELFSESAVGWHQFDLWVFSFFLERRKKANLMNVELRDARENALPIFICISKERMRNESQQ